MTAAKLKPVDKVEILTVIDNTTDMLLGSTDRVQRPALQTDSLVREPLVAEHGYSALVKVTTDNTSHSLLLDTGLSTHGVTRNLAALGVDLDEIETIVLSHGHVDHTKGLLRLVERLQGKRLQLVLHPNAFLNRRLVLPNGNEVMLPPPERSEISDRGVEIREQRAASTLFDDSVMVTGEIPRLNDFEKGIPAHQAEVDGCWQQDAAILDDQALVIQVKNKGLVILTGCGHAGIVNTVHYAQKLTGIQQIHAILGGFHLSGPQYERVIPPTVAALTALNPDIIVPGHCTGWQAIHAIAQKMPRAYVPNSVGTRIVLD